MMQIAAEYLRRGYVYCIRDDEADAVKIGFSKNPISRLRQLQTANSRRLRLLCVFDTTQAFERSLHRSFAGRRLHGEWFRDEDRRVSRLLRMAAGGEA